MHWFDGKIVDRDEVTGSKVTFPAAYRIGDECKLFLEGSEPESMVLVTGIVHGINITHLGNVTYDIAVPIESQGLLKLYAVLKNVNIGVEKPLTDNTLNSADILTPPEKIKSTKPELRVIKTDDNDSNGEINYV